MARIYATEADLTAYTGQAAPDNVTVLLRDASQFLDANVFRLCWYHVGDDGLPSDTEVAEAFSDAVCAQVQWWDELGDSIGAAGAGWGSVQIGRMQLARSVTDVSPEASAARQFAPKIWDALAILSHHHFRLGGVRTW